MSKKPIFIFLANTRLLTAHATNLAITLSQKEKRVAVIDNAVWTDYGIEFPEEKSPEGIRFTKQYGVNYANVPDCKDAETADKLLEALRNHLNSDVFIMLGTTSELPGGDEVSVLTSAMNNNYKVFFLVIAPNSHEQSSLDTINILQQSGYSEVSAIATVRNKAKQPMTISGNVNGVDVIGCVEISNISRATWEVPEVLIPDSDLVPLKDGRYPDYKGVFNTISEKVMTKF